MRQLDGSRFDEPDSFPEGFLAVHRPDSLQDWQAVASRQPANPESDAEIRRLAAGTKGAANEQK